MLHTKGLCCIREGIVLHSRGVGASFEIKEYELNTRGVDAAYERGRCCIGERLVLHTREVGATHERGWCCIRETVLHAVVVGIAYKGFGAAYEEVCASYEKSWCCIRERLVVYTTGVIRKELVSYTRMVGAAYQRCWSCI